MNDSAIMDRLKDQLETVKKVYPENDWFGIFLQGSQNYGLVDKNSDIDSKVWFIPSIKQIVLNLKPISHTHIMENEEHVDCKDIREYFKILRKQNINFMEVLFTDYFIINPKYFDLWVDLQASREAIARSNEYRFLKCAKGMVYEKSHALCHPYPSKIETLKKYGADLKQLSHAIRVYNFAVDFILIGKTYKECLNPNDMSLMKIKRNQIEELNNAENATKVMDELVNLMEQFELQFNKNRKDELDPKVDKLLNDVLLKAITRSLKEEINV